MVLLALLKEPVNAQNPTKIWSSFFTLLISFKISGTYSIFSFKKSSNLLFANPIDIEDQGVGPLAKNEGWLFDNKNMENYLEKTSKIELANNLIDEIISINKWSITFIFVFFCNLNH